MPHSFRWAALASLAGSVVLVGCGSSSDNSTSGGSLTITSSSIVLAGLRASLSIPSNGGGGNGVNATSIKVGMYSLYVSTNADCSSPVLVEDYGSTPVVADFVAAQNLFSGSPAAGSYNCAAIKMSDVVQFTPATDLSPCQANTPISEDVYPSGETDFRDINLAQITGHGGNGNGAGVDDKIYIILTTNPSAAESRGFSANQIVTVLTPLTPPETGTLVWNATGTVQATNFTCVLPISNLSFR